MEKVPRKSKAVANLKLEEESVKNLINDLVLTSDDFDPELLRKLLQTLGKMEENRLRWSYDFVWSKLKQKHSQLRWMCVQLLNKLFYRSATIRRWLIQDLQEFVALCISPTYSKRGVCSEDLPPPTAYKILLRNKSIRCLFEWKSKFGCFHKKLTMCWDVLHQDMQEVFDEVLTKLRELEEYKADKALLERAKLQKKVSTAEKLFQESIVEVHMNIRQATESLKLLREQCGKEDTQHGDYKHLKIVENCDNKFIFKSLDDSMLILRNFAESNVVKIEQTLKEISVYFKPDMVKTHQSSIEALKSNVRKAMSEKQSLEESVAQLHLIRIKSGIDIRHLDLQSISKRKAQEISESKSLQQCSQSKSSKALSSESESSEEDSDLEDVAEKEGIEFMNPDDLASALGDREGSVGDPRKGEVHFSLPNLQSVPDAKERRQGNKSRRKKKKLMKKNTSDNTSRKRLSKKIKKRKL